MYIYICMCIYISERLQTVVLLQWDHRTHLIELKTIKLGVTYTHNLKKTDLKCQTTLQITRPQNQIQLKAGRMNCITISMPCTTLCALMIVARLQKPATPMQHKPKPNQIVPQT